MNLFANSFEAGLSLAYFILFLHNILVWRKPLFLPERLRTHHSILGVVVLMHLSVVLYPIFQAQPFDFGLGSTLMLISACVLLLYWCLMFVNAYLWLGLLLYPLASVIALGAYYFPAHYLHFNTHNPWFVFHVLSSVLAYSLFALAAILAGVLLYMEKALHQHRLKEGGIKLPSLLGLESKLFSLVSSGFVFLSIALITGIGFSELVFGTAFTFTHKVIFGIASWLVFGGFLLGKHLHGWRGRLAIHWILTGFALLVIGYAGSKFVLEVLLNRS